jgi:hypothetical protein
LLGVQLAVNLITSCPFSNSTLTLAVEVDQRQTSKAVHPADLHTAPFIFVVHPAKSYQTLVGLYKLITYPFVHF